HTSLNGHMFSVFNKDNTLSLRLSDDDPDAFMKKHKTTHPVQFGVTMTKYAVVPDAVLANTAMMKKDLLLSQAYVKTLKPKAMKKNDYKTRRTPLNRVLTRMCKFVTGNFLAMDVRNALHHWSWS